MIPWSRRHFGFCVALIAGLPISSTIAAVPADCQQLIVSLAESWDSPTGQLQRFERRPGGWVAVSEPQRVLFGKKGLAWGIGIAGQRESGRRKVEGDQRAPAGLFELGRAFGYAPTLQNAAGYPYHRVTAADAWIEDPTHPQYNRHLRVDVENPPAWFRSAQMKQNDPAHRWKLEIRHNSEPPVAGMGSAIFFHIQRGPGRYSAGCTTMPEAAMLEILAWVDPSARPHYVLLPRAEYGRLREAWKLPSLSF